MQRAITACCCVHGRYQITWDDGDKSWTRPFADAFGWTDAFLDRILMTVILIRDEVEHSRFSLKPLSLLTSGLDAAGSRVSEAISLAV